MSVAAKPEHVFALTCSLRASSASRLTKHVICNRKSNSTASAAYSENTRTAGMCVRAPVIEVRGQIQGHRSDTGSQRSDTRSKHMECGHVSGGQRGFDLRSHRLRSKVIEFPCMLHVQNTSKNDVKTVNL